MNSRNLLRDLDLRKPDFFLEAAERAQPKPFGNVIRQSAQVLAEQSSDAVLVAWRITNSCSGRIRRQALKDPTFHMEAGNRCFEHAASLRNQPPHRPIIRPNI